jgi:hypothetical protein
LIAFQILQKKRKKKKKKKTVITTSLSISISLIFPPNLEGKENFEAAFLSAHFHAIYKVSYFVCSKQNILLTKNKKSLINILMF